MLNAEVNKIPTDCDTVSDSWDNPLITITILFLTDQTLSSITLNEGRSVGGLYTPLISYV